MRLIHYCLAGVLSFLSLASFAGEIAQGTLKNGMRYYLYSDVFEKDITVALAVKKPEKLAFLPLPDPFNKEERGKIFPYWGTESSFYDGYFEGNTTYSALAGLDYMAGCLKSKNFPPLMIDELREDYREELQEFPDDPEWQEQKRHEEVQKFLFGDRASHEADFFAKDDEEITAFCRELFNPSRLAIIATGSFNLAEMEKEIERLFGDIQGDGALLNVFQPQRPLAITIKEQGIFDMLFNEEKTYKQEINLCLYRFVPSFRNYVLNDLFFFTQFNPNLSFCPEGKGRFQAEYFFPFVDKTPFFVLDEQIFGLAKKELKKRYENSHLSIAERCKNHFILGIEGSLELNNQQLLSELENVQLEDLNAFISETVQNIPISREFNFL